MRTAHASSPAGQRACTANRCLQHHQSLDMEMPMNASLVFRGLCIAASLFSAAAWADPPARVGRITLLEGKVSFHGERDAGWRKAQLNYPVTSENSLWTEARSRAEVRIGPSALRLDDDSVLDIVALQDDSVQGYLQRGSIHVRLRTTGDIDGHDVVRIDTPQGRFILDGNGRYRIDADLDGRAGSNPGSRESRIAVFSGGARFEGVNGTDTRLAINAGKQFSARINDSGNATDFRFEALSETNFDRWAEIRDREWDRVHERYARAVSPESRESHVSPYMTGYEDLDANGEWIDDREYGRLWAPRLLIAGWAPYRYGRWNYVQPWGWTWIDDAPWGFAPFHYGRWVQVRSRWCWWPGTYVRRPVYAPALVAWFGGAGAQLTIGSSPAVGWFPLAPREHYIPHYTTNIDYLRRINHLPRDHMPITAPPHYRNHVPGATIVNNTTLINGERVGRNRTILPPQVIAGHTPNTNVDRLPPPRARMPGGERPNDGRRGNVAVGPRLPPETLPSNTPRPPRSRGAEPGLIAPQPLRTPDTAVIRPNEPAVGNAAPPSPRAPSNLRTPAPPTAIMPDPVPTDPAGARDTQVRRDGRGPGARYARPAPESAPSQLSPPQPYPSYAPQVNSRPPVSRPIAPGTDSGAAVVRHVPEHAVKPRHESAPEVVPPKTEIKDARQRPGMVRE